MKKIKPITDEEAQIIWQEAQASPDLEKKTQRLLAERDDLMRTLERIVEASTDEAPLARAALDRRGRTVL